MLCVPRLQTLFFLVTSNKTFSPAMLDSLTGFDHSSSSSGRIQNSGSGRPLASALITYTMTDISDIIIVVTNNGRDTFQAINNIHMGCPFIW